MLILTPYCYYCILAVVVSVYINHKKCFAFVELKSIELTTACLELDGIVYRNSVLKVQRANEYKPEAVGSFNSRSTLKLNLLPEVFSGAVSISAPIIPDTNEPRLTSLIVQGTMASIERGAVVLLGFPFDEGSRRSPLGRPGSANGPKIIRRFIARLGALSNPEFGLDLGNLLMIDIGDIPVGLTLDEAHARLALIVAEVIHRGGIPFVLGGSNDLSYFNAAGLMTVAGGSVGVVNVSSQLHVKPANADNKIHSGSTYRLLLEDTRFCPPRNGLSSMPSCDGKLLTFGCQGSVCSAEQAKYVSDRNGVVTWLTKDIRSKGAAVAAEGETVGAGPGAVVITTGAGRLFRRVIAELSEGAGDGARPHAARRPLMCAFNVDAISSAAAPGGASASSLGFTAEETLDMCFAAGADPNVVLFDVTEYNPDVEEPRTGRLIADMFYYYVLGVASRTPVPAHPKYTAARGGYAPQPLPVMTRSSTGELQQMLQYQGMSQSASASSLPDAFDLSNHGQQLASLSQQQLQQQHGLARVNASGYSAGLSPPSQHNMSPIGGNGLALSAGQYRTSLSMNGAGGGVGLSGQPHQLDEGNGLHNTLGRHRTFTYPDEVLPPSVLGSSLRMQQEAGGLGFENTGVGSGGVVGSNTRVGFW